VGGKYALKIKQKLALRRLGGENFALRSPRETKSFSRSGAQLAQ
jgi:hypothetical protein